jgi:uncharacterized membrane protein YfcA
VPTIVFAYGAATKTAGTARLLISLPTVAVGITAYARRGAYEPVAIVDMITPMRLGSVFGAEIGGLLVGSVSAAGLKVGLGIIQIVSAWRTFRRPHR